MTQFRPCIDLHDGKVKQIVGGTLSTRSNELQTNFVSTESAEYYARLYRKNSLKGGHIIKLGPGNDQIAREALAAYPSNLQIGGGISVENAADWLTAGASHVIVTSWLFSESGRFERDRLLSLVSEIGKERLVIDLSCRKTSKGWTVAMNRWQTLTDLQITSDTLEELSQSCAEFLIHAADVEGKCLGIDEQLVEFLGENVQIPTTYAGGANSLKDLDIVKSLSHSKVDVTIGSALDIFGGNMVQYDDCVEWNSSQG